MLLRNLKLMLIMGLVGSVAVPLLGRNCKTARSCKRSQKCKCYCSAVGHFREKNSSDKPVWVENDPNGIGCYCKKWDLKYFPLAEGPEEFAEREAEEQK